MHCNYLLCMYGIQHSVYYTDVHRRMTPSLDTSDQTHVTVYFKTVLCSSSSLQYKEAYCSDDIIPDNISLFTGIIIYNLLY